MAEKRKPGILPEKPEGGVPLPTLSRKAPDSRFIRGFLGDQDPGDPIAAAGGMASLAPLGKLIQLLRAKGVPAQDVLTIAQKWDSLEPSRMNSQALTEFNMGPDAQLRSHLFDTGAAAKGPVTRVPFKVASKADQDALIPALDLDNPELVDIELEKLLATQDGLNPTRIDELVASGPRPRLSQLPPGKGLTRQLDEAVPTVGEGGDGLMDLIMGGTHRLTEALMRGEKTAQVARFRRRKPGQ